MSAAGEHVIESVFIHVDEFLLPEDQGVVAFDRSDFRF